MMDAEAFSTDFQRTVDYIQQDPGFCALLILRPLP